MVFTLKENLHDCGKQLYTGFTLLHRGRAAAFAFSVNASECITVTLITAEGSIRTAQ
jgi:hypothetical protein